MDEENNQIAHAHRFKRFYMATINDQRHRIGGKDQERSIKIRKLASRSAAAPTNWAALLAS